MAQCAVCGVDSTQRCSGCHQVSYCSTEHQRQHWPTHKAPCKAARAAKNTSTGGGTAPSASGRTASGFPKPAAAGQSSTIRDSPLHRRGAAQVRSGDGHGHDGSVRREPEQGRDLRALDRRVPLGRRGSLRLLWRGVWTVRGRGPAAGLTASVRKARLYLPSSWNPSEDEPRALQMAQTHEWANIHYAVEKADINEHYKSSVAAMGLRMWTEQVTKSNLNGRLHGH